MNPAGHPGVLSQTEWGLSVARIPNDLIADLRNALHDLGGASAEASDLIREQLGADASRAFDDVLAACYQIVEAAAESRTLADPGLVPRQLNGQAMRIAAAA